MAAATELLDFDLFMSTLANFPHPPVFEAFTHAHKCLACILPKANACWLLTTRERFGCTHQTNSPRQWATQAFALNLSGNLACHISRNRSRESDRNISMTKSAKLRPPSRVRATFCILLTITCAEHHSMTEPRVPSIHFGREDESAHKIRS